MVKLGGRGLYHLNYPTSPKGAFLMVVKERRNCNCVQPDADVGPGLSDALLEEGM